MVYDEFGGFIGWDFEGFYFGGDMEVWKRFGFYVVIIDDDECGFIIGICFVVWVLNVQVVEVIFDFNWWIGDCMCFILGFGVWGIFVEGVDEGIFYKFCIQDQWGIWYEKVDLMVCYLE